MGLNSRSYVVAAWIGIALLVVAVGVTILTGQWHGSLMLSGFTLAAVGFVAFEDRLPTLFDLLFVLAAGLNAAGYVWGLYHKVWFYDEATHFYTTFAITLAVGFLAYHALREPFREHMLLFMLAIASFGIALGAVWEIFEWTINIIGTVDDAVIDLIMDTLGAFLAGGVGTWALRRLPQDQLHR